MSNSSGNYALENLPDGLCYNLHVSAPENSGLAGYHEDSVCVSGALTKDVQLSAGGTITGSVTVNGAPVANAQMDAWGPTGGGWANTGADGTYTMSGLATGTYTVSVRLENTDYPDYTAPEKTASVTAGQTTSGVNFELSIGGSISGTVTYADGAPVANIRVEAWQEMQDWSAGGGHGEDWTASDGTYMIKGLSSGTYRVEARMDDPSMNYAVESQTVTVTAGQTTTGVNFVLSAGGSISGTVTDSTGNPVANAELNAWQSEGGYGGGWAMTGSDGTYTMTGLSSGTYNIEVRAGDYSSAMKTVTVTAGQDSIVDFVLSVGGSISGTVTYSDDSPASNLRVECWNEMGSGWGDAFTDTTGAYTISGLSTGTYRVEVRTDDSTANYAVDSQTVSVTAGQETTGVNFVLSAGGSVSGTVTDASGPVANIRVECWNEQGSGWGDAMTATEGTYTINGLSTGTYRVMVRSEEADTNYATAEKTVSVTAGQETTGVDFVLTAGGSISGTVTYAGSPVANMRVECWKQEGMGWGDAWTESDGTYTITGLSSGVYELEVRSGDGTTSYASSRKTATVVAGQETSGVDFALSAGASISGTVTYGGSSVSNMRVECWNEQGSGWGDSITATDGTYTISGLSAGTYRVKVRNDWDPTGASATSNYASGEMVVILTAGQQATGIDFALTLGGSISGTVTHNAAAVSHLRIETHCENCDSWGEAMTSETGEYSVTGLSTGTYRVGIRTEWDSTTNYATEEQTVSVVEGQETAGVDFVLTTGGSISGTVTYNGDPVAYTNVGAWCESDEGGGCGGGGAMTESDGTYAISSLMSGTYHVDIYPGDAGGTNYASEEKIITVTAGEAVTGADFALTAGGSISGVVIDGATCFDGCDPIPNIRVQCWMENGAGWGDAWTGSDGTYSINGLSTGTYHVEVRASESGMNYASKEKVVSVTAGQETSGVNFNLTTGASISGTVIYSGGSGASDIMVEAHKEMEQGWGNAWTESDGTYTITGLTSGTYRVEIFSDYAAQPQMVTVNTGADTSGVDFTLTTGGSISGTVTDANGAVAYINIHAWSETGGWGGTMTESDGTYTITGLYSGTYHVNVDTMGSSQNYASSEKTVTVTEGQKTSGVNFNLSTGGSVSGTVKDEAGSPVPDMRVECWKEMGEGHGETMVKQDGTYTVKGLKSGIYHCTVRAQWGSTSSYATDEQTVTATAGQTTTGVNFVLSAGGSISGTVTYSGSPMGGVIVDAWSEVGGGNAMTDSNGAYTVTGLGSGTYHVNAHPFWSSTGTTQNIASEEQTVTVTAGTETSGVNFDLTDGASISGSVTLSGAGVPYVKIEAFKENGGGWGGIMTESDGTYTITGLSGGTYFVEARLEGTSYENYATKTKKVTLTSGQSVTGVNFNLTQGGSISGTVTDSSGPVAYMRVEAWKEGAPGWGGSMTASDGTYTIPGLSAGIYHIEVHFGWGSTGETYTNYACDAKTVTVAAGQTTSGVNFVLATGGTISGTVTAGGQAVSYVRVEAWKEESPDWGDDETASDGTYTISGLTTGTYHVKVRTEGTSYSGYASGEKVVSVTAGQDRTLNFNLTTGASISGNVTAGGAAAQYVRIDAWRDWESGQTPDWGDTITASDGTYTITGLMGGKYHVNVRAEGTSYSSYASLEQTVTVTAGSSRTGVDFALTTGGSILGTVTMSGSGTPYVRVWAWREGAPDWGDTVTDSSGAYTISGLSSGSYHVGLELEGTDYEGYAADEQTVAVTAGSETSGIGFALAQGGSISGTVTNSSGAVAEVHVEAWNEEDTGHGWTKTDSSGAYTITGLSAGTYNIEVWTSGYASVMQSVVSVTAGQTTSGVDFTLAAAGSISGTVTYDGSGVADIEVFAWSPTTQAGGEAHTDASGNYLIEGLPEGTDYKVKVEAEGYASTMATSISVTGGETTTGVDFELSAGGTLSGTVTDSDETPLEEANINIWVPGEGFGEDWEDTGDDGTYIIEGIPAGTYTVEAYLDGYEPVGVNVTITEGVTKTQDFTLQNSSINSSVIKMASIAPGAGTAPTASAGPDQTISLGTTLYVSGGDSADSDGTIQSYAWNFGDGDIVYGVTQFHVYSTPGTYTVTLTVTDDEGLTDTDTLKATITAASAEPTANSGNDQTVDLGNSASLDGSASSDSDGEIISYHWDFNDGSDSTEIKPSYKYSTAGTYTATLEITDDDGLKDTDTLTISVSALQDPVADAGTDQTINEGESVTLDASGSYDTDGTIDAYGWKEGTTVLSSQSSFTKSDFTVGTHTITLTVTDNDDNTDTDEVIVTVLEGGTIVRVRPASVSVEADESFSINITSTETDNVLGIEFVLLFNKSVLQATSVKEGTFLKSDGKNTTGDAPAYSNTAGTVTFSRSRSAGDGGLTASGVIATINFNSIASGSVTLRLQNVTMRDVNGTSISLSTSNGAVTVGTAVPGDVDGNGTVSDFELLDYIDQWSQELVGDFDLLAAIASWATAS
ncbi:MAG: carboxypeptidase regulatory-like domain-containing protein [Candidatus Altiarchaeales archaeon]|nr:carboxypeptidase regulatory-like domain-containing protein [Candidatus Altiarchaeales archaeon]